MKGTMVLIQDSHAPPLKRLLGHIVGILHDADDIARVSDIQTRNDLPMAGHPWRCLNSGSGLITAIDDRDCQTNNPQTKYLDRADRTRCRTCPAGARARARPQTNYRGAGPRHVE
ncbi:hypothetical protein EVAR_466_1 [Eumeta japonica]|uniref:Uncharacterized protein n=1 Tax=Eumeta variegata TaxID=151549 RepID=A0A4C1SAL4_EUMVA|nr:hypothetical protein EVAR_466_1 [Eumeta japonica]